MLLGQCLHTHAFFFFSLSFLTCKDLEDYMLTNFLFIISFPRPPPAFLFVHLLAQWSLSFLTLSTKPMLLWHLSPSPHSSPKFSLSHRPLNNFHSQSCQIDHSNTLPPPHVVLQGSNDSVKHLSVGVVYTVHCRFSGNRRIGMTNYRSTKTTGLSAHTEAIYQTQTETNPARPGWPEQRRLESIIHFIWQWRRTVFTIRCTFVNRFFNFFFSLF